MEKGLQRYEANAAEPPHLHTASPASLQGTELLHYYTAQQKHNTLTALKPHVIGQNWRFIHLCILNAILSVKKKKKSQK